MKSGPELYGRKKTKKQLQMFGARSEHTVSRHCQPHDPQLCEAEINTGHLTWQMSAWEVLVFTLAGEGGESRLTKL